MGTESPEIHLPLPTRYPTKASGEHLAMESSLHGAEREAQRSSLRVETTANFPGLEDRAAALYEARQRYGVVCQDSLWGRQPVGTKPEGWLSYLAQQKAATAT
jgi:hypothetical protein